MDIGKFQSKNLSNWYEILPEQQSRLREPLRKEVIFHLSFHPFQFFLYRHGRHITFYLDAIKTEKTIPFSAIMRNQSGMYSECY